MIPLSDITQSERAWQAMSAVQHRAPHRTVQVDGDAPELNYPAQRPIPGDYTLLCPNGKVHRMIAFLGWGSLVWDPGALPIHRRWHTDGPYVRTEFLRKSSNGRLTLVLSGDASPVRSLWATYAGTDLGEAREALCDRESVLRKNIAQSIGSWSRGDASPECVLELEQWATARGITSVVWTSLPPKFNGSAAPSIGEAISYLSGLTGPTRDLAERYIRYAPRQIDTEYRRRIEAALGWSCVEIAGVGA